MKNKFLLLTQTKSNKQRYYSRILTIENWITRNWTKMIIHLCAYSYLAFIFDIWNAESTTLYYNNFLSFNTGKDIDQPINAVCRFLF
jgi:hypothetical protein